MSKAGVFWHQSGQKACPRMAQKLKDDGGYRASTYCSVWYRHPSHHSTCFQVTVLLFWSSQPPLATPLWTMKLNWVMFSDFQAIYHMIMVCLSSQRLLKNEMILKVSDFYTPYHSKHFAKCWKDFLKSTLTEISDQPSNYLLVHRPEQRNWLNKFRLSPEQSHSWTRCVFLPLRATPSKPDWYTTRWQPRQRKPRIFNLILTQSPDFLVGLAWP